MSNTVDVIYLVTADQGSGSIIRHLFEYEYYSTANVVVQYHSAGIIITKLSTNY